MVTFRGSPLLLRYESSELVVENTGHVVEVMIPTGVNSTPSTAGWLMWKPTSST